jgi:hypothetical protein
MAIGTRGSDTTRKAGRKSKLGRVSRGVVHQFLAFRVARSMTKRCPRVKSQCSRCPRGQKAGVGQTPARHKSKMAGATRTAA